MHELSTVSSSEVVEQKLTALIDSIDHTDEEINESIAAYLAAHPGSGEGISGYVYDRNNVPASNWIITHNLNRYPQVTLIGDDGYQFEADILYNSLNQVTVVFSQPTSGKAALL